MPRRISHVKTVTSVGLRTPFKEVPGINVGPTRDRGNGSRTLRRLRERSPVDPGPTSLGESSFGVRDESLDPGRVRRPG